MTHKIPTTHVEKLTAVPSPTKITQVSTLQNYIQELLGDTHHTFLQGSYLNDTAISDINDVDIVAVRKMTYSAIHSPHPIVDPIPCPWGEIFTEIENKLKSQSRYSWTVTRGDKCIKIRGAFNTDVIPAIKVEHDHTIDPIVVYSNKTMQERKNFPRVFYNNGVAKNKATNGFYKPTVRMFKNWAVNHINNDKCISSFKIQALLYNVPNENFNSDYPLNFLLTGYEILDLLKPNGLILKPIMSVCGSEDINIGWDATLRQHFINKLTESLSHALVAYKAEHENTAESSWKTAFKL